MKVKALITVLPFLLPVILHISATSVFAQGFTSDQIDSLALRAIELIPEQAGFAVGVVKDGKLIHAKGYGLASVDKGQEVDADSPFAIASLTKAFTSTALAILVDEGKLDWDNKVIDYIPEFRMYDPYVTANFTITDLLTHRSGLGLGAGDLMHFPDGSDFTISDILGSFEHMEPASAFRTKYDYDNLLYIVAGEIIERISGMSYGDFLESRIFSPLEMEHSAAYLELIADKSGLAQSHTFDNGEVKQISSYSNPVSAPAGGIYASITDMCKWMLMNLNNGRYGEKEEEMIVTEDRMLEIFQPVTKQSFTAVPDKRYNKHLMYYGLGWEIVDNCGYIVYRHGGGLPGMLSRIVLIPELQFGVVVLTNSFPGGNCYFTIPQSIVDSYLGLDQYDWIERGKQVFEASKKDGDSTTAHVWKVVAEENKSPLQNKLICGVYHDPWFGDVVINDQNGELWIKSLRSPKLTGQLFYYQANTYAIKWNYRDMNCDALASFDLDPEGRAIAIRMKGISPNIDFSFDFQDLNLERTE